MTRRISDLDVPLTALQQQMRELVARQRAETADLADRSAQRLAALLAPTTTPEESSS
ncbi:hypothetical protein ACFW2V_03015 [Streptomyces sp. NPDC058947]|uniref:hypothetical protein n=1 Tax=Streptomyces sp. NPDC058947 TaxID=3346675 RepID=UPI0036AD21C1